MAEHVYQKPFSRDDLKNEYYDGMKEAVQDLRKCFSPPYHGQGGHEVVVPESQVGMLKGIIGDNRRYLVKKIADKKSLGVSFVKADKEENLLEEIEANLTHVAPKMADAREIEFFKPYETNTDESPFEYDVFICHASEDKDGFVDPLAEALSKAGLRVWYDDFIVEWGDGLRSTIDRGLKASRYGIVVLSRSFFEIKKWTEHELSGLFAKERPGEKVILPIWHDISREDVLKYSPPLADRVAKRSDQETIEDIVAALTAMTRSHL